MKKVSLCLLLVIVLIFPVPFVNSTIEKKIPSGFTLSTKQIRTILAYNQEIYYIVMIKDTKTNRDGYLFFDSDNQVVTDQDTYSILAQDTFILENTKNIMDRVDFKINRHSLLEKMTSSIDSKFLQLSEFELKFLDPYVRRFCLGGENILLYSLLGSTKPGQDIDPEFFFGTMKWALRRSAWQNYWIAKESLDVKITKYLGEPTSFTCLKERDPAVTMFEDLQSSLFFGALYQTVSDPQNEEKLWKPLYETLLPDLQTMKQSLLSRFSDILYQKIKQLDGFGSLHAAFRHTIQQSNEIKSRREDQTDTARIDSTAQKILQSFQAPDSPMFRFNTKRSGRSQTQGPRNANLKWKKQLGNWIVSSPVILPDQTILIGCFDGYLYHLSTTGDILWKYLAGSWLVSTPAVASDGTIYFGNQNGYLFAVSDNGIEIWRKNLFSMIGSSPLVTQRGDIIVGCFDGFMVCLQKDGTIRWRFKTSSWILSSPAMDSNGNILFGSTDSNVYCINPSGDLVWKYKTGHMVVGSPAIDNLERVIIGSMDGFLYCFGPDGKLIWQFEAGGWIVSSPAIGEDNKAYFADRKGTIYCLDPSGKLVWRYQANAVIEGSPVIAKDILYITSWDRNIYAIENGILLWKYAFASESRSTPAIDSSGTLYVGSEDQFIYAFQDKP